MTHDPYSSLRSAEFRAFLISGTVVVMATQVQSAVLGWQAYMLTRSPLSLGLVGLFEVIPFLSLTLMGGWAADRVERRALAFASQAVLAISSAVLLLASFHSSISIWILYGAQALAGVGRAFYRPSTGALAAQLVDRQRYQNSATWRTSAGNAAMVIGPALGGALIALGGPRLAYAMALTLIVVGFVYMRAVAPRPPQQMASERITVALAEGIRFVITRPLLLGAMTLDMFAVLFGGATALLPIFAQEVLRVGEVGFGFLRAAPAIGAVLMSLLLTRYGHLRRAGQTLLWSVGLFGLTWILFAVSPWYWASLMLLIVGGAFDTVSVVVRGTLLQALTPADKMGRVSAVSGFFIGSSNELGAFESGVAARCLGLVTSVVFGGLMTLATVVTVAWRVPSLRGLRSMVSGIETGNDVGQDAA